MSVLHNSRQMVIPPLLSVRTQAPRSAGAVLPWYRAGGAPLPVAAYLAKGAASYAASKINLAQFGTYDAVDGANPLGWTSAGWSNDGNLATLKWLNTGIVPSTTWAMMIAYSGTGTADHTLCGIRNGGNFELWHISGGASYYANGALRSTPLLNSGTLGFAEKSTYRNGVPDTAIGAGAFSSALPIFIGGTNNGTTLQFPFKGTITAWVIWSSTSGHATWMPAVSAAMAAL